MIMKIIIDPIDDILYKSFYIYALEQRFGSRYIHYSHKPFCELSKKTRNSKSIRFVIQDGESIKRFAIACNDSYQIIPELYNWADIYGSVNANFTLTPLEYRAKLVSLCPSFAIKCWTLHKTIKQAFQWTPSSYSNWKKYLGKHKRMLHRQQYADYLTNIDVCENYIFTCNTLWYNDEWNKNNEGVNLNRAHFIRACKDIDHIKFEGGFVAARHDLASNKLFEDCLSQPYSTSNWMMKTKQSICVFNTPAFWRCHGWKLGEFMALGKAIISTPLSNDLPAPLIHGQHIHLVSSDYDSISEAIRYIASHPDYRKSLEHNISAYWDTYGTPQKSLELLGL